MSESLLLFENTPFLPTRIGGGNLKLWLDASDTSTITHSSGSVSAWADKSGNGNNATQGTGSSQPTTGVNTINGKNVIAFDGGDQLDVSENFGANGYTVFTVLKLTDALANMVDFPRVIRSSDDAQSHFFRAAGGNGNFEIKSQATGANDPRPAYDWEASFSTGTSVVIANVVQLDSLQMRANGTELASENRDATASSLSVAGTMEIGLGVIGHTGELIVYDRVLSASEIAQVESYLTNKWTGFRTPTDIQGLQAWYDTTDDSYLTLDGTAITQMLDRSGQGNDTDVQGTASARPTRELNQINGLQAATFDGGDYLSADTLSSIFSGVDKASTVILVCSSADVLVQQYVMLAGNDASVTPLNGFIYNGATPIFGTNRRDDVSTLKSATSGTVVNNTPNIFTIANSGTTVDLLFNNDLVVNDGDIDVTNTTIDNFTIGASDRGGIVGQFFNGVFSEALIYDRALTSTEIDNINNYLSNKYNIGLA